MRRLRRYRLSDARDVDLAEKITQGVIKELFILQHLASEYSGRPLTQIDVPAQKILAMAMYQMRSLARVPTHAIVDDAVEQARDAGLGGAGGFVNAVLRKAAKNRAAGESSADGELRERAERETSFPREVFDRFAKLYGQNEAFELCKGFNREPPALVRLIGNKTIDDLIAAGAEAKPHQQRGIVVVENARRAQLREWAAADVCQTQDATSAATVDHLDLQPGQRVLDRCCGRGTKTRQILERVGPTGKITAMDPSEERLISLKETLKSHAITNIEAINAGTIDALGPDAEFDRVLIDAPCSNSGTFARRPEARYHQNPRHVARVVELQRRILVDSGPVVAPGGRIVYATCSVWPEENEAVVDAFLKGNDRFRRVTQHTIRPKPSENAAEYRDGGFVAVLVRR
jgi:16S rRNA (cytosine967-C5)-methyltransferase